jgi:hypothetical protein
VVREGSHQIGAADDANEPPEFNHRHALDQVTIEQLGNRRRSYLRGDADHWSGHQGLRLPPIPVDIVEEASGSPSARSVSHQFRRDAFAAPNGRSRSPSLIIPSSIPLWSQTGAALIPLAMSTFATSATVFVGATVVTFLVMMLRAVIVMSRVGIVNLIEDGRA